MIDPEIVKKLNEMKSNLDFVNDLNTQIFSQIPEDKKDEYANIMADTKTAIECLKKGDSKKLNKLHKKYANSDS